MKLGIAGLLADRFKQNQITPLLALLGLLLGLFAVLVTPREEEPQIEVTFANVFIGYPGASVAMVEQQVAIPAEKIVAEIAGIEHVYSVSEPGRAVLTVQFKVGQARTEALVRLYNAFYANADWQPAASGIGAVLIKPRAIDDVPVFAVTLWSKDPQISSSDLHAAAKGLEEQLQQVPGSRDVYSIGAIEPMLNVRLDPQRLQAYQLSLPAIQQALLQSNQQTQQQAMLAPQQQIQLHAGSWLSSAQQVGDLIIAVHQQAGVAKPVYLRDVADIQYGQPEPTQYVQQLQRSAQGDILQSPAVTVVVAKQPGQNAVDVTQAVQQKLQQLKQTYLAQQIELSISRNYGETAADKADTLIHKLFFATAAVVLLVGVTLGWREAWVVGAAVVITLALTLFASWAYGFTLNRVSLFALIFSIGILVDDAIVVVENLHRHWQLQQKPLAEAIALAVEEVGAPTILATLTVIAALLPMAFVSGLMGPYMSPIPINASMGMLISLLVAFILTPWLFLKAFAQHQPHAAAAAKPDRLQQLVNRLMRPFLQQRAGRRNRLKLLAALLLAIVGSVALVASQQVILKMLPFDNKSELQLVVDLPEGSTLEQTQQLLNQLSLVILQLPEVTQLQTYAGTAAPINFNGLVRQYYLRQQPWQGDIQISLQPRQQRDAKSHAIALRLRAALNAPAMSTLITASGANLKLVEIPPGPPVLAPLVAEVYGPDYPTQLKAAAQLQQQFAATAQLVDVDSSIEVPQALWQWQVDQQKAALLQVSVATVSQNVQMAVQGTNAGFLRAEHSRQPVPLQLKLSEAALVDWHNLAMLPIPQQTGGLVALSELGRLQQTVRENSIYRKDLRQVVYVTADLAGGADSPLYGMLAIRSALQQSQPDLTQWLIQAPSHTDAVSLKWDGEWQITYETFRDMGLAYAVGLILIYLLIVAQFKSYRLPLIIMAPIPLTLIGIMPGHWLLQQQFSATSMIGMIALAGIIVRNSILLVDAVQQQLQQGIHLEQAVINATAIRTRPIVLTALAAMLGALFILDDPIFGGLAVSLIFGILIATCLTLLVIPVVYYAHHYQQGPAQQRV